MKLTDNYISEETLNDLIDWASISNEAIYKALIELRQRRAEFQEQAKRFVDMMLHKINGTNEDEKCPKI